MRSLKLDLTEVAEEAVREAWQRHREELAQMIDRLANESQVTVNGVRHINVVQLWQVLVGMHEDAAP